MGKSKKFFAALSVFVCLSAAPVKAGTIESVPSAWRLQDYIGGAVIAYYVGTACAAGNVTMAGASSDEINRFWIMVLNAKTTGKMIGVVYNDTNCAVQSFYTKEK